MLKDKSNQTLLISVVEKQIEMCDQLLSSANMQGHITEKDFSGFEMNNLNDIRNPLIKIFDEWYVNGKPLWLERMNCDIGQQETTTTSLEDFPASVHLILPEFISFRNYCCEGNPDNPPPIVGIQKKIIDILLHISRELDVNFIEYIERENKSKLFSTLRYNCRMLILFFLKQNNLEKKNIYICYKHTLRAEYLWDIELDHILYFDFFMRIFFLLSEDDLSKLFYNQRIKENIPVLYHILFRKYEIGKKQDNILQSSGRLEIIRTGYMELISILIKDVHFKSFRTKLIALNKNIWGKETLKLSSCNRIKDIFHYIILEIMNISKWGEGKSREMGRNHLSDLMNSPH
jgi:hypothetical protein